LTAAELGDSPLECRIPFRKQASSTLAEKNRTLRFVMYSLERTSEDRTVPTAPTMYAPGRAGRFSTPAPSHAQCEPNTASHEETRAEPFVEGHRANPLVGPGSRNPRRIYPLGRVARSPRRVDHEGRPARACFGPERPPRGRRVGFSSRCRAIARPQVVRVGVVAPASGRLRREPRWAAAPYGSASSSDDIDLSHGPASGIRRWPRSRPSTTGPAPQCASVPPTLRPGLAGRPSTPRAPPGGAPRRRHGKR